jgi:catechol 2,3-dioxygenase
MIAVTTPTAASAPVLPATLRLGAVHLTVSDVDRSVAWYQQALGLWVHRHEAGEADLGDGTTVVLHLVEDPRARPPGRHAGIYHYALLYPSREELARAVVRLSATRTYVQGASDHGTHEAIYLPDPDGIGIELAADRPREQWPTPEEEFSGGGPKPLDVGALLSTVADEAPTAHVAPGLRMGHVHLHVGSIEDGLRFYRDVLGFEVWAQLPTAAFVAAGGYHHHLGFNVWQGEGAGPAPEHTAGLRHWTIDLGTPEQVAEARARVAAAGIEVDADADGFLVRDPWDIAVYVGSAEAATSPAALRAVS